MMTVVLLVGFAAGVVGLLVVTPVLERWATSAPSPLDAAPARGDAIDSSAQA